MSSDFWAGYMSGAVSILVGNPLDVVKIHLQAGRDAPIPFLRASRLRNATALLKGMFHFLILLHVLESDLVHSLE